MRLWRVMRGWALVTVLVLTAFVLAHAAEPGGATGDDEPDTTEIRPPGESGGSDDIHFGW